MLVIKGKENMQGGESMRFVHMICILLGVTVVCNGSITVGSY